MWVDGRVGGWGREERKRQLTRRTLMRERERETMPFSFVTARIEIVMTQRAALIFAVLTACAGMCGAPRSSGAPTLPRVLVVVMGLGLSCVRQF